MNVVGGGLRAEVYSPEARRRRKKLDPHPLALSPQISQIDDSAFQFFLGLRVRNYQHFAVVHFMLQQQEATKAVDDHGFACLAELLSVVAAALRLNAHLVKDSRTSPGCGCSDFAHGHHLQPPTLYRQSVPPY